MSAPRVAEASEEPEGPGKTDGHSYRSTAAGLVWDKPTPNGTKAVQLTNFTAKIVIDETVDNGAETTRFFWIEAHISGADVHRFKVSADQFGAFSWVHREIGPTAVVFPGQQARARTAIQLNPGAPLSQRTFVHTGWRQLEDGRWVFLHAGGAVGPEGPVPGVCVQIDGPLSLFRLPDPPSVEELRGLVRASLRTLLRVAPLGIMAPLLGSVFRAVVGDCDFSVSLCGGTGVGKSELAALAQQFFGAGMDRQHLPASWSSTANALEETAFLGKDVLLVVDDFVPRGSRYEVDKQHGTAERFLRAVGNHAGRSRMRADTTLRAAHPPQGLILSTGEEPFRGQSLNARVLTIDVRAGMVRWDRLTHAQDIAARGDLAQVMAGFVSDLAKDHGDLRAEFLHWRRDILAELQVGAAHRRTPGIFADLTVGWGLFLDFAEEVGALTPAKAKSLDGKIRAALEDLMAAQEARLAEVNPAERFLGALKSLLDAGVAHLEVGDDDERNASGWRCDRDWGGMQGDCLGYVTEDGILLNPAAAFGAVQRFLGAIGESLPISQRTLQRHLDEGGYLVRTEMGPGGRQSRAVRRTLNGKRSAWLHLRRDALNEPPVSGAEPEDAAADDSIQ